MSVGPVALLAGTGVTARTLVLGGFAEAVARERPVVAYVQRPDLVAATGAVPDGVELRPYPDHRRYERASAFPPSEVAFELEAAVRRTESMELLGRVDRAQRSGRERLLRGGLRAASPLLRRPAVRRRLHERYLAWARAHPETRDWRAELASIGPAALVTSRLTLGLCRARTVDGDLAAHLAASELGIAQGTLVQSWDNITSKPAIVPSDLDRWWVWSTLQGRDLLLALPAVDPHSVEVVGSPAFDPHHDPGLVTDRATIARDLGLDPARPWIVVGGGHPRVLPHEPALVARLIELLARARPEVQVVVRPHPKGKPGPWRDMAVAGRVVVQTADPDVAFDEGGLSSPSAYFGPLLSTLSHAAAVVCTGSTLLVDAAAVDTPAVTLCTDLETDARVPEGRAAAAHRAEHIRLLTDSGAVAVARSVEQAVAAIEAALDDPSARRSARARLVRAIIGPNPGRAGTELAMRVLHLAEGGAAARRSERGTPTTR